jgi:hypothetical protein
MTYTWTLSFVTEVLDSCNIAGVEMLNERKRRIVENEGIFRSVNEQVRALNATPDSRAGHDEDRV